MESESNLAIIYSDSSYQPLFAESGGLNPLKYVILAYEVLRRFRTVLHYEDVFALWWAHTVIYEYTKHETNRQQAQSYEAILNRGTITIDGAANGRRTYIQRLIKP